MLGHIPPTVLVPRLRDVNQILFWSYGVNTEYTQDFALAGMGLERWNIGRVFSRSHQVDSSGFEEIGTDYFSDGVEVYREVITQVSQGIGYHDNHLAEAPQYG